jgi:DNA-binding response OmpR family regulator
MSNKVLIIEDNRDIADLVSMHVRDLDCEVTVLGNGSEGLKNAIANPYDLVILDLMLPGMDGLDVCRELRSQSNYTPVLMLTSKSSELDRVLGLEIGADDYLTKPFSIRELLARIKAIFRRVEALGGQEKTDDLKTISIHDLEIDTEKRLVSLKGKLVDLTAKEFELLWHFSTRPGRVYTRSQLLDSVWGYGHEGYEHTVNSHINRLRAKIEEDPSNPRYILTVWGVGYKFTDRESSVIEA